MRRNKTFKIFGFLIGAIVAMNSNSLIFASQNKTETKKENTEGKVKTKKQQIEEKRKKNYENFKKNLKLQEKDEEELLNESIKTFKNFKEEDYKMPGFKLTVYWYSKVPILYYEHEKTKAKIVLTPLDSVLKLNNNPESFKAHFEDNFIFNAFTPNDKGMVHYLEHCLVSDFGINLKKNEKYNSIFFNAETSDDCLTVIHSSFNDNIDENFYRTFFKALRQPEMLRNNKTFEIEKRRIIVEQLNAEKKDELQDIKYRTQASNEYFYNSGGATKELKKIENEDVKKYFKSIIHPSNLLITRYVELNKEKIKKYLNLLEKEYLNYFNYKEINIPKYEVKKNVEFLKFKTDDSLKYLIYEDEFSNIIKNNYTAIIDFYNDAYDGAEYLPYKFFSTRTCFDKNLSEQYTEKLQKFVEDLGYSKIKNFSLGHFSLFGKNKELFEKEKLKENSKKILEYELKLFEELKKEEFEENIFSFEPFEYYKANKLKKQNEGKFGFTNPINLLRSDWSKYYDILKTNFIFYKDPFSQKQIFTKTKNNNELISSKEDLLNLIEKERPILKENLKNLNPKLIMVYEKTANKQKGEDYYEKLFNYRKPFFIPLKFKDTKNNEVLEALAKQFVTEKLDYITKEIAINYYSPGETPFFGKYVCLNSSPAEEINKQEVKFYYDEFNKISENLKITEKEFNNFMKYSKKNISHWCEHFEKDEQNLKSVSEEIENYLKNGVEKETESSKNKTFKITKETKRNDLFKLITNCEEMSKNFEEYLEIRNKMAEFALKYGQIEYSSSTRHIPIQEEELNLLNKTYVKDLNELIFKPKLKAFNNLYKLTKKALKEIDKISYKDFVDVLKSLSLVEKEEYEKDQKEQDKIRRKMINSLKK